MIAALVPAAGSSSRMGRPKLLLEIEGQSLIGRVVSALRSGGALRVVVVAPPALAPEGPAVAALARRAGALVVVPGTQPAEMRDSIELGLESLAQADTPQSIILTPGDYPGITPEIVAQLVRYAARMPDCIVIPSYNGRRGHPIVLPWKVAAQIHSLPPGVGVNGLVAEHGRSVVELEVSSSGVLADLDTPVDLQEWERRQNSGERRPESSGLRIADSRFQTDPAQGPSSSCRFRVRVRLFALAKDRAGHSDLELELVDGAKVADLRAALGERVPSLLPLLSAVMIAVDEEYAGDDTPVFAGSRLAVIPPVSGGAAELSGEWGVESGEWEGEGGEPAGKNGERGVRTARPRVSVPRFALSTLYSARSRSGGSFKR